MNDSMARRLMTALFVFTAGCCMDEDDDGTGGSGGEGAGSTTATGTSGSTSSSAATTSAATTGTGGGTPAATHSGIVSIQDVSIHGVPQAGHGLTVQILMNEAVPPTWEDQPGSPTGCRAWSYDVDTAPPPALTDQGEVTISGIDDGTVSCSFQGAGYVCPAWTVSGEVSVTPGAMGVASYAVAGTAFTAADVGRYLRVVGGPSPNHGAFPIVAVNGGAALVLNPAASSTSFDADVVVLVGAGPVPGNQAEVFDGAITVGIEPGGASAFDFPDTPPVTPGNPFQPDDATKAILAAIPVDGSAVTFGCSGTGGDCGDAQGTVIRISSTDGSVAGLSPFAMPPPAQKQVEIQCAILDDGPVTIPAAAMALLEEAHAASPITRIRTAFMREGVFIAENPAPAPPNPVFVLAGRGILGFTTP